MGWRLRRGVRRGAAVLMAVTVVAGGVLGHRFWEQSHPELRMVGIELGPDGQVREIGAGDGRARTVGASTSDRRQQDWLAAGRLPAVAELGDTDLVTGALLDLHTLAQPDGVAVAGWAPAWRYVWPRDTAFVASALARTGHLGDAERNLAFLQRVQPESGMFQARYRTDGTVPDDRGVQQDGTGWALWSLAQVADQVEGTQARQRLVERYRQLLDRSSAASLALAGTVSGLPPVSPDYWEVSEKRLTLATCAALLTGLRSAAHLYTTLGRPDRATVLSAAADRVQAATSAAYAPDGFPRRQGGSASSVDLGATFLLAPFAGIDDPALIAAWQDFPRQARRPAGGLAPGGSWRNDGISWTPTTATYAIAAACRDRASALHWLTWLDRNRTASGALPEKVLADGTPASVAPLAWTAAAVVVAVDELERGC